jgi:neuroblastoma-amplified sequence
VLNKVQLCHLVLNLKSDFCIAKTMIYGSHKKINLDSEVIETVCLSSSRELYDNANSGNYKFGDMKLAYDW